jgi:hypothetical protein
MLAIEIAPDKSDPFEKCNNRQEERVLKRISLNKGRMAGCAG